MNPVLALDLSTPRGVIAVTCGAAVLFEAAFVSERSHNARLFAPLAEALAVIGERRARMVVGTGPGSYTGVRIAIAAAQGVAVSRGWTVAGLPTLACAPGCRVLGDARRGFFYIAAVSAASEVGSLELVDERTWQAAVSAGGDWVTFDARAPLGLDRVRLAQPDAVALARIAEGFNDTEMERRAARPLEPLYLQDAFITTARKAGKLVPGVPEA